MGFKRRGVPSSPILAARIRSELATQRGISEKAMFGGICFLDRGNMMCGTLDDDLVVRVGKDAHAKTLALPHVEPMVVGPRPITGILRVGPRGTATDRQLARWIERARAFTRTLPAK